MIKSFAHKGLEKFFLKGTKAGIQPAHSAKLRLQLYALNSARKPGDMGAPGWDLHPLGGDMDGYWSVSVNGNWRMTFRFDGEDAEVVNYEDYH